MIPWPPEEFGCWPQQNKAELARLMEIYEERRPRRVLEIGTYLGGTLYYWLNTPNPKLESVVCVDLFLPDYDNRKKIPLFTPNGVAVNCIQGNSTRAGTRLEVWKAGLWDWAFIDGSHKEADVAADVDLALKCRRPGVVVLHDITPNPKADIEVRPVWERLKKIYPHEEIIADPEADCGGIGVLFIG